MNTSYAEAVRYINENVDDVEDIASEEDFELLSVHHRCSLLLSWFRSTTPDSIEAYLNAQGPGAIEELCAAFSALLPTIEELRHPNVSDGKRLKSKADVTHRAMPGARAVAFAVSLTSHGSKLITAIISDHPEAAPSVIEGLVDAAEVRVWKVLIDPHVNISCSIGKVL